MERVLLAVLTFWSTQIAAAVAGMGVDQDLGAIWIAVIEHAWTYWMPLGPACAEDVSNTYTMVASR